MDNDLTPYHDLPLPPLRHHQALTWFFVRGGRTSDWKVCRTLASVSANILNPFFGYTRLCGERYRRGLGAISGLGEGYFRFATLVVFLADASECDDGRTGDGAEVDLSCKSTCFSLSPSLNFHVFRGPIVTPSCRRSYLKFLLCLRFSSRSKARIVCERGRSLGLCLPPGRSHSL